MAYTIIYKPNGEIIAKASKIDQIIQIAQDEDLMTDYYIVMDEHSHGYLELSSLITLKDWNLLKTT